MRRRGAGIVAAATVGYLIGTTPSADIASRLATGGVIDLRESGSGNPGGANAVKVLGPAWGYGVIVADIGKGALASRLGRALGGGAGAHAAGAASVVGHCFPVWNGFRGGKGVGAAVGQCLMTFPAWFPLDVGVAVATASTRFRSRARMATMVSSAVWVVAGVVWWRRRWPNLWGPRPTIALPMANAVSAAVIAWRFLAAPDPGLASPEHA